MSNPTQQESELQEQVAELVLKFRQNGYWHEALLEMEPPDREFVDSTSWAGELHWSAMQKLHVNDIMQLLATREVEVAREARIDEHARLIEHGKSYSWERLDLVVEYKDGTNSGVVPYREHWNDAYDRFIVASNSRLATLNDKGEAK